MKWNPLEQLIRALFWEGKKLFYKLRFPVCGLLCAVILIWILPREACDFLRSHAGIAVMIVNVFIGLGIFAGILFLPEFVLSAPCSDRMYPMEKLGGLSQAARLAARLLIILVLMAGFVWTADYASGLMNKFATSTQRFFRIDLAWGFSRTLVINGLVQPLVFLWILLRRLRAGRGRQYILSYILATLFTYVPMAAAELKFLHFAPGNQPPAWFYEVIWYLVMLGTAAVFFRLCCREELRYH